MRQPIVAIEPGRYSSSLKLELREIEKPAPGDDDLLIRVHAAGVDPGVWHLMTGLPYLVRLMYGTASSRRSSTRPIP